MHMPSHFVLPFFSFFFVFCCFPLFFLHLFYSFVDGDWRFDLGVSAYFLCVRLSTAVLGWLLADPIHVLVDCDWLQLSSTGFGHLQLDYPHFGWSFMLVAYPLRQTILRIHKNPKAVRTAWTNCSLINSQNLIQFCKCIKIHLTCRYTTHFHNLIFIFSLIPLKSIYTCGK